MSDNENNNYEDDDKRELKNSIFSARQAVQNAGNQNPQQNTNPEMSKEEYVKRELGFDIPVDEVPLPSKGLIYPSGHVLHNKDRVEYRAMTAREEDILMSRAYIKKGTVITELIKSCVMNSRLDVNSLISGDRNALMIAIRASGYGSDYNPMYTCPNCSYNNELSVNLSDLPVKPLTVEPSEPFSNYFHFTLPLTKKTVGFKFLTGEEEARIIRETEAKKKRGLLNNNTITTRLLSSIVDIDGNNDRNAIAKFVQYMPARDSLALRSYIDEHEPGVDMSFDFQCNHCDFGQQMQLPIGPSFLWPTTAR